MDSTRRRRYTTAGIGEKKPPHLSNYKHVDPPEVTKRRSSVQSPFSLEEEIDLIPESFKVSASFL